MSLPSPDQAFTAFMDHLREEKRASRHTVDAYGHDVRTFLFFMNNHLGGEFDLTEMSSLRAHDIRAFLAFRRRDQGLDAASLARPCRR